MHQPFSLPNFLDEPCQRSQREQTHAREHTWSACGATDCVCATVGAMRNVPCGMCGTQSERCTADMTWTAMSACIGESACAPAAVETRSGFLCRTEQRLCSDLCAWSDWQVIDPGDGTCERGTREECPGIVGYYIYCDDMCHPETTCRR
jgi:hypothetical protein